MGPRSEDWNSLRMRPMLLYCLGLEKLSYECRNSLGMRPANELGANK